MKILKVDKDKVQVELTLGDLETCYCRDDASGLRPLPKRWSGLSFEQILKELFVEGNQGTI